MSFKAKFSGTRATFPAQFGASGGGSFNPGGLLPGVAGADGATFYPSVAEDGTLSWTNDKGLDNPDPVNIKGPAGEPGQKGETGSPGQDGAPGRDGYTPVKGKDYFDGKDGADGKAGKNGTSCTHQWSGTTLYITSASGTTSANLKGDKGNPGADGRDGYTPVKGKDYFDGKDGQNGKDGYTPVKGVDYFDGANGENGKDGEDGYTPVKGKDYFTEADKAEMVDDVIAALPVYDGSVTSV